MFISVSAVPAFFQRDPCPSHIHLLIREDQLIHRIVLIIRIFLRDIAVVSFFRFPTFQCYNGLPLQLSCFFNAEPVQHNLMLKPVPAESVYIRLKPFVVPVAVPTAESVVWLSLPVSHIPFPFRRCMHIYKKAVEPRIRCFEPCVRFFCCVEHTRIVILLHAYRVLEKISTCPH